MTKATLTHSCMQRKSSFLNSVQDAPIILLYAYFFISNTLTLTSLLLATYCIFPRALSPYDSGGLMQGGFLKLTLETTEVNISAGSAGASPSVWVVSSRRLWAALTLLESPCAARVFRWARE